MEIPRTRKEALKAGAPLYYTGKLCSRGHRAQRLASNGTCTECTKKNFRLDSKTYEVLERNLNPLRKRIADLEKQVYELNKKLHAMRADI